MSDVKEQLKTLLKKKKSKEYYAQILNIDNKELERILREIKLEKTIKKLEKIDAAQQKDEYISKLEDKIVSFQQNIEKGEAEVNAKLYSGAIKTLEELIDKCNIDTTIWKIKSYVQNFWGNGEHPHWQVKAFLSLKTEEDNFKESFKEFLKTYQAPKFERTLHTGLNKTAYLIINKQDSHLNKFDEKGYNNIEDRFSQLEEKIDSVVKTAAYTNNLENITYIIGSDQFNSEWMGTTTKGTPQKNILSYHDSFEKICNHEITVIENFLSQARFVDVIYIPGNHDEYVGWHMVNFLKAHFKNCPFIKIDDKPDYTKCIQFSNTGILLNHGDDATPKTLSEIFPVIFKDKWSSCDYFYILTGDKHTEKTQNYGNIKFLQIPALSASKSKWDMKKAHEAKAELTAFLIEEDEGMTAIYKKNIKKK